MENSVKAILCWSKFSFLTREKVVWEERSSLYDHLLIQTGWIVATTYKIFVFKIVTTSQPIPNSIVQLLICKKDKTYDWRYAKLSTRDSKTHQKAKGTAGHWHPETSNTAPYTSVFILLQTMYVWTFHVLQTIF